MADNTLQSRVNEAGRRAEAEARNQPVTQASEGASAAQAKAADPSSDFPERSMNAAETRAEIKDFQGPAGSAQADDQTAIRPPVAGKRGEQDLPGDAVGGINKSVGDYIHTVGDTEAGRKGTGGVDISNAYGMGGV